MSEIPKQGEAWMHNGKLYFVSDLFCMKDHDGSWVNAVLYRDSANNAYGRSVENFTKHFIRHNPSCQQPRQ